MKKNFITGFIAGGIICATVTGFAVEYAVSVNPFPVKVNGVETSIQGYNINDETYFKLRDVSAAVGGFEVGFEDNAIIVNTPQKPTPAPIATSDITIVKGEDGNDYTSNGLQIYYKDDVPYVKAGYIQQKIAKRGFPNYTFTSDSLIDTANDWKPVLTNIPVQTNHSENILLEYYISTLAPFIDNLSAE